MVKKVEVFSIGFTKVTAEKFFETLIKAGVKKLVDVRLANVSQLAGFAKKKDLEYFLRVIGKITYVHKPEFAPTKEMLDEYRGKTKNWVKYEDEHIHLIESRRIETLISLDDLDHACMLCSEYSPLHCHRRLVLEYLKGKFGNIEVNHLVP